jgi:hypothetical protein
MLAVEEKQERVEVDLFLVLFLDANALRCRVGQA